MVSSGNEILKEHHVDLGSATNPKKVMNKTDDHSSLSSTSKKGLLGNENPSGGIQLLSLPSQVNFLKLSSRGNLASPPAKFRQITEERDETSHSVPSSTDAALGEPLDEVVVPKRIDWANLRKFCKEWIRKPYNIALLFWISCVAVSGAILFFVMTGMLNGVLPKKSQRNTWFEVNNQILSALFTLMCLYQHPKRCHHFVLLCRWKPKDISDLRKIYCKNGTSKPHEWTHMMVVVILLHINCFAQYALCGLNLGCERSNRPAIGVGICLSVAITAPAVAGVYCIMSPLGWEYDLKVDEEDQGHIVAIDTSRRRQPRALSSEKRLSFASRNEQRVVEQNPVWSGGLLDFWDDIALAYLSLFCSFCLFGWNMERLGFGNMYVHIATFVLVCVAPFWIFNLAAVNINDDMVREVMAVTGVVLCLFGLLYGGFWRTQMRRRFNLPANNMCCGKPAVADCAQWLFCCWCSLAQEVRTADFYDIVDDKFCKKLSYGNGHPTLSPLPREHGADQFRTSLNSPPWNGSKLSKLGAETSPSPTQISVVDHFSPSRKEETSLDIIDESMKPPPIHLSIERK